MSILKKNKFISIFILLFFTVVPFAFPRSIVVVELFTSEGCSSCPVAEDLLNRLVREGSSENFRVYPLAFHVDYWDYLGFKDRFAQVDFTQRQQEYRGRMFLNSLYTPQIIVNGTQDFVGSNEKEIRKAIINALKKETTLDIDLVLVDNIKSRLTLAYSLSMLKNTWKLITVIVQKQARTDVDKGENRGRSLEHLNVVRAMSEQNLTSKNGEVAIKIPKLMESSFFIMAYVQDTLTGEIIGAKDLLI